MSTPFQSAMHYFVQASVEYASKERCARFEGGPPIEAESERALAQAGDVLESALLQMMREEVARAVRMQRAPEIQVRDDW